MDGWESARAGTGFGIETGEEESGLFVAAFVEVVEEVGAGSGRELAGEEIEMKEDGTDGSASGGGGFEFEEGLEDGLFDVVHGCWVPFSVRSAKARGGEGRGRGRISMPGLVGWRGSG